MLDIQIFVPDHYGDALNLGQRLRAVDHVDEFRINKVTFKGECKYAVFMCVNADDEQEQCYSLAVGTKDHCRAYLKALTGYLSDPCFETHQALWDIAHPGFIEKEQNISDGV